MAVLQVQFFSESVGRFVQANVYLPAYEREQTAARPPFKTLYMLHGFTENAGSMSMYFDWASYSTTYGIAVVIPSGENAFYVDKPDGYYGSFSRFIGEELVDVTRGLFPLSHKREDTYIGGISMGGYGAMYNGLRYRDRFSRIVAMSPAAYIYQNKNVTFTREFLNTFFVSKENYENSDLDPEYAFLQAKKSGSRIPDFYICCGRQDPLVYEYDVRLVKVLRENEISVQYREDDGIHNNAFWSKYFPEVFQFLLDPKTVDVEKPWISNT